MNSARATELTRRECWACIMDLTRAMLALAQTQDWDGMAELESRREALLDESAAAPDPHGAELAELVWQVMDINRQIIVLSEGQQLHYYTQLQEIQMGRSMARAYGENR